MTTTHLDRCSVTHASPGLRLPLNTALMMVGIKGASYLLRVDIPIEYPRILWPRWA